MISPEDFVEKKWLDSYRLSSIERLNRSNELRAQYIAAGGSLAPEYDPTSPFNDDFYTEDGQLRPVVG